MKLTTTTLGCPGWSIDEVIEKCSAFGFQGVDFRGLEGNLDVTVLPEFREHISTTKMKLEDFCLDVHEKDVTWTYDIWITSIKHWPIHPIR